MEEKLRLQPYFLLIFCHLFNSQKVTKHGRKVKAIALLFSHFLPLISFFKKWQKMDEKLRLQPYGYSHKAIAKNGRKVKAIRLLFAHFVPLISFLKMWEKMAEKLRPFIYYLIFIIYTVLYYNLYIFLYSSNTCKQVMHLNK